MRDREDWIWLQPDRHLGKVFEAPSNETQVKRPEGVKLNFFYTFILLRPLKRTQRYEKLQQLTLTYKEATRKSKILDTWVLPNNIPQKLLNSLPRMSLKLTLSMMDWY